MIKSPDDQRPAAPAAAKPSLEDLLRLKRAERPDAAFWEEFDRGLRQKQLAAIIEPRPWWIGLAILSRRIAPLGLPFSAAAAALLAVMVLRTESPFNPPGPVVFAPLSVASDPAAAPAPILAAHLPAAETFVAPSASPETAVSSSTDAITPDSVVLVAHPSQPAAPSAYLAKTSETVADSAPSPQAVPESLPAEAFASIPSHLGTDEAGMFDAASPTPGTDAAPDASSSAETELRMVVFNPRHARVLLAMAENDEIQAPGGIAQLRDRTVRSLVSDDALSASASRLGVGGDRLSVSF
jgi:hypothetical protein